MAGATEVRQFQVTCAAGTAQAAPQVTNLVMPTREVLNIRIRVPPGPNGNMGFALGAAGNPVIPVAAGTFIIASDEVIEWALEQQIDSGAWQVFMFNTGIFPHTIYLLFTVELPDLPAALAINQPLAVTDLVAAPVVVDTGPTSTLPTPPELT